MVFVPSRAAALALCLSAAALPGCVTTSPSDVPESVLEVQAGGGDPESQYRLGLRLTAGQVMEQDYAAAAHWFAEAAEGGHLDALYMLGIARSVGRGVPVDRQAALADFEAAADRGHVRAMYQVGDAYMNGRGAAKERAWGARWLGRAARRGHRDARFDLGVLFAVGRGLPQRPDLATAWLDCAAADGHEAAARVRAKLVADGAPDNACPRTPEPEVPVTADSPTVLYVQESLKVLGFDPGPLDGLWGPTTASAARRFAAGQGLDWDGQVSPPLLDALRRASLTAGS
ncbi:MAG: SEL1-like repeat protein [Rhodobacterales bacterium]|nr:SEL1-like repeat protein [Rhodobacterales bacterium]